MGKGKNNRKKLWKT